MLFSQTTEYALRAVVDLAENAPTLRTNKQIAESMQVPLGYLSKVMQELARAGVVQSHRGIGGGFSLARPAREISLLEVVNAVDPIKRIKTCPLNLKAHANALCPLHKRLDDAIAAVESSFEGTTLADLVEKPDQTPAKPQQLTVSASKKPRRKP